MQPQTARSGAKSGRGCRRGPPGRDDKMGSMTTASRLLMTEEEFLEKYADELPSYEFVNGVVTRKPMTQRSHFQITDELLAAIRTYRLRAGGLSGPEPTVDFSDDASRIYRVPDIGYWSAERQSRLEVLPPPTLAIEVLSPGQTMAELREKCRFMRASGTDVCWLINPDTRRVEVFEADRDGDVQTGVLESAHLPGFRLELAELFSVLD
ncbi:MAG: hypothetical protein C0506_12665 [Anaerolinea sp.]|nr:hypothetical protein [Anaerolinea sp.]